MERNGKKLNVEKTVSDETLRAMLKNQRIASTAVHKAQEENRRLGVPNWYSVGGVIVSDAELADQEAIKK